MHNSAGLGALRSLVARCAALQENVSGLGALRSLLARVARVTATW
ncbi:hypothetical protein A2U01_0109999 [Trifolium medium]|uniref:Uncharacterized protein n=1 Tax=Trifolium medium TaxID=97028 RepID=A0A392VMN9_9FABA|nr:hypothetical protein [Trifolium medium]